MLPVLSPPYILDAVRRGIRARYSNIRTVMGALDVDALPTCETRLKGAGLVPCHNNRAMRRSSLQRLKKDIHIRIQNHIHIHEHIHTYIYIYMCVLYMNI